MAHINIEIKARCGDPDRIRAILLKLGADVKGTDHQIDTYFKVPSGRLKLRQGTIENSLIFYDRPDDAGPKRADVSLFRTDAAGAAQIHQTLTAALDVLVVVDKQRDIYFIDNVKFHIDRVEELGSFVEIEAIDETGQIGPETLRTQCEHYMSLFAIRSLDLIESSYSDLLLAKSHQLNKKD
ncbi:MAG: class IV adenylate cyclase [Chitinivibrionales bacterium]|nr:class IV adenylate cyclase [Chitinivibrionales bacterium]